MEHFNKILIIGCIFISFFMVDVGMVQAINTILTQYYPPKLAVKEQTKECALYYGPDEGPSESAMLDSGWQLYLLNEYVGLNTENGSAFSENNLSKAIATTQTAQELCSQLELDYRENKNIIVAQFGSTFILQGNDRIKILKDTADEKQYCVYGLDGISINWQAKTCHEHLVFKNFIVTIKPPDYSVSSNLIITKQPDTDGQCKIEDDLNSQVYPLVRAQGSSFSSSKCDFRENERQCCAKLGYNAIDLRYLDKQEPSIFDFFDVQLLYGWFFYFFIVLVLFLIFTFLSILIL